mmetsp:Transcript_1523/g.1356  ORF Transcript_1523/g.1356 Transcript_1523/m.1356 type:complete len:236 (-) Transcript_1523:48-755(-)
MFVKASQTSTNLLKLLSIKKGNFLNKNSIKCFSSKITIEEAKLMSKNYHSMPNDVIISMAVIGDQEAREEMLIREIMSVDSISWDEAQPIFNKMLERNRSGLFLATLPYKIGIFSAVSAGFLSIPMIFHLDTVMWFNEIFVTSDVPEPKDLETPLEVGSWAWNWMEPPLGQISFFLLCMQYARSQLQNLGAKPYTQWFLSRRAHRLSREFPKYNAYIVTAFSEGDPLSGGSHSRH